MPKQFYTERDIEDLFQHGTNSLELNENVVLTELAFEKARQLGVQLISDKPEQIPSAPIRPYLSRIPGQPVKSTPPPPAASAPTAAASQPAKTAMTGNGSDLSLRIRGAVIAKLGNQVEAGLLDTIIQRVLKSTGLK